MKVFVTGSAGFIAGYLIQDLLDQGHEVVGVDNFSKCGRVEKSYQNHSRYRFVQGDCKDARLLSELVEDCDHFVACAGKTGGITYSHEHAYELICENQRIAGASFDAAIKAFRKHKLQKITLLSGSGVYENATVFPTPEGHEQQSPPPSSSSGLQVLACESFAKAAWEQHKLAYTIVRPFNCVGTGEKRLPDGKNIPAGNIKPAMGHVVPDLVLKVLKGQDPLHILGEGNQVRCYTYGGDLARGIRLAMVHPTSKNQAFNISTPVATSVLELAEAIWTKIHKGAKPFKHVSEKAPGHDVQKRIPNTDKAKRMLGFEATTTLSMMLDEVIPWVQNGLDQGQI